MGAPILTADASIALDDDAGVDDPIVTQPPDPPMTGGLTCGDTFCPFVLDPGRPCCTEAEDVMAGVARETGRCGADLRALDSSAYGAGCWQRDQLGVQDVACPEWTSGELAEPGCCTAGGECGTFNADQKLGCRNAPGAERRACGDQSGGKSCDPLGTYGLKVSVDVTWGGTAGVLAQLTENGRGRFEVYLLGTIRGVDPGTGELDVVGRVCGATLPAFESATLCESYQAEFPNELWDSPSLPPLELSGRYQCSDTGCSLSIAPVTYLLGIQLLNPESLWPSATRATQFFCQSGRGEACFLDHDGDGRPGVEVHMQTSGTVRAASGCNGVYQRRAVPLAESLAVILDGARRADRALLGMRTKLGGSVRLGEDCDRVKGSAIADYINARAFGCMVQEGTYNTPRAWEAAGPETPCDDVEARFADTALPVYTPLAAGERPAASLSLVDRSVSVGPKVSLVRLGASTDEVSCARARDAEYED